MTKLGIKITRTYEGYADIYSANLGSWSSEVKDVRNLLGKIVNISDNEIPLILSITKDGAFLILIRPIGGRDRDNITAWIYIPSNVNIAGKAVEEVVDEVKKSICGVKIDNDSLDEIFSREYDTEVAPHKTTIPRNEGIAIKKYGNNTNYKFPLYSLLDSKNIFQPDYFRYTYVLFVDSVESRLECPDGTILSDTNIVESIIVHPVEDKDGFSLYYKEEEFKNPIYAYKGEKLPFVWKRRGYKDVAIEYTVDEGKTIPHIERKDWGKRVDFSHIGVFDKDLGHKLDFDSYKISINNGILNRGGQVTISEDALKHVRVVVTAEGYNTYEGTCDLSKAGESLIKIGLEPKKYICNLEFTNKEGQKLKVSCESKKEEKKPPFLEYENKEGYILNIEEKTSRNKEIKRSKLVWRIICFIAGLVIGLSISITYIIVNMQEDTSHPNKPNLAPNKVEISETDDAIEYLDKAVKWNKSEMEEHSKLKGLWDALNKYDFKNIKSYEHRLNDSKKFMELIEAINEDKKNKDEYQHTFCTIENDEDITFERYIKKIKEKPKKSTQSSSTSSSKSKNSKSTENTEGDKNNNNSSNPFGKKDK